MSRLIGHGRHGRHPAVVEVQPDHAAYLNLANANARVLLDLLGLSTGDDLAGSVALADGRRAVIRARRLRDQELER